MLKKLLFLILIVVGFGSIFYFSKKWCVIKEFGIKFKCSSGTIIQYWPDVFKAEFVTIRKSPLPSPQKTDEDFYDDGFVISRVKIEDPTILTTEDWVYKLNNPSELKPGELPITGITPTLIDQSKNPAPNWERSVVVEPLDGLYKVLNVKDYHIYTLTLAQKQSFSSEDLTMMLKSLKWMD